MKKLSPYFVLLIASVLNLISYLRAFNLDWGYTYSRKTQSIFLNTEALAYSFADLPVQIMLYSIGLMICLGLLFTKNRHWETAFAILMVVSLTPLFKIWPFNYYLGIGIFKIELLSFFLLALHLIFSRHTLERMNGFLKHLLD